MKTILRTYGAILLLGILPAAAMAQPGGLGIGQALPQPNRPAFDVAQNRNVTLNEAMGAGGALIVFWSNQCPWTRRYEARIARLAEEAAALGMRVVLVNSNNAEVYPKESSSVSRAWARGHQALVYLADEGAAIARALGAERTPQAFLFDASRRLVYRGAIDDSPGDEAEVSTRYVWDAIVAMQAGRTPTVVDTKPFGCQIRY